jgi:hypothetical protein
MRENLTTREKISSLGATGRASIQLQRKCACSSTSETGGECEQCKKRRLDRKRSLDREKLSLVPPIVYDVLRTPGDPLDATTRALMESRFGHDFSKVRVHTSSLATTSARSIDAAAYTVGNHIAFDAREYSPQGTRGLRLLAHELMHVIQQRDFTPSTTLRLDDKENPLDSSLEHEARQAEGILDDFGLGQMSGKVAATQGFSSLSTGIAVQRQESSPGEPLKLRKTACPGLDSFDRLCSRCWAGPFLDSGKVIWSNQSLSLLGSNARLLPEDSTSLILPSPGGNEGIDGIYFGDKFNHRVLKVPDHCTAYVPSLGGSSTSLDGVNCCCNSAGATFATIAGRTPHCRFVTPGAGREAGWPPNTW